MLQILKTKKTKKTLGGQYPTECQPNFLLSDSVLKGGSACSRLSRYC